MASPIMTQNALGNVIAGVSVAATATSALVAANATTKFEIQLQFDVLTGAGAQASATATIKVYRAFGPSLTQPDNVPITQLQVNLGQASTHYLASVALPTGNYNFSVTNGDGANPFSFSVTSSTIDAIV